MRCRIVLPEPMKWKNAREIIQNVPFLRIKFQLKICKMKTWAQDIDLYEVVVMIARKPFRLSPI